MNRDEAREAAVNEAVEFFLGDEFNRVTVQEQFGKLFDAGYQAGSEGRYNPSLKSLDWNEARDKMLMDDPELADEYQKQMAAMEVSEREIQGIESILASIDREIQRHQAAKENWEKLLERSTNER